MSSCNLFLRMLQDFSCGLQLNLLRYVCGPLIHKMMSVIGEGQQPLRHVGSASRSLSGNQAEKVVFNGSPSEYFGPLSAKPGLFSAGEPASAFEGSSGVVAGTVMRRWNGNGGRRRWGPVSGVAGPVSPLKGLWPGFWLCGV